MTDRNVDAADSDLAPCLMLQGTSSHVGKSVLVTAFCRIFSRLGYRIAPFKAQNMANNSYVTPQGYEIGRAQGIQAEAAQRQANTNMNPVLLKPSSDGTSQVVLHGKPRGEVKAREYREDWIAFLWPQIKTALYELRRDSDMVIIEGAGSPSEINLRDGDMANMSVAKEASARVLLVSDIERGGMLASVVGTLELLPEDERDLVKGILVNKFRGDLSLLQPGLKFLEEKTNKPVLGTLPYIKEKLVDEEDSVALEENKNTQTNRTQGKNSRPLIKIGVVKLPRISNFTDFEPLKEHPAVELRYLPLESKAPKLDCLIIPGTKATLADLQEFVNSTLYVSLSEQKQLENLPIFGICGGYQMLGLSLNDEQGIEGKAGELLGLGLLPVVTNFSPGKHTYRTALTVNQSESSSSKNSYTFDRLFSDLKGTRLIGYEIHMGETEPVEPGYSWLIDENNQPKGTFSQNGRVMGTFLHGIFNNNSFTNWFLSWVVLWNECGSSQDFLQKNEGYLSDMEKFNILADHVESALDMGYISKMLNCNLQCKN